MLSRRHLLARRACVVRRFAATRLPSPSKPIRRSSSLHGNGESRGAVDHHAVALRIERLSGRSPHGDQLHRSAGALGRRGRAGRPFLERGSVARARPRDRCRARAAPARRGVALVGSFARRLCDPQPDPERRRRARQPRGAVRRAEPRRVRLGVQSGQRVQWPCAVPQAPQWRRERCRARHRVPDAAQRRQRQVRAA